MSSRSILFIMILIISIFFTGVPGMAAETPPEPSPTPLDERAALLNKRLNFVALRGQLQRETEHLNRQIKLAAQDSDPGETSWSSSEFRTPVSLKKPIMTIVILNFIVLSLFMLIRHKSQEPKP
jgi:hypothetical protein